MDPFSKGVVITITHTPGAHTCIVATLKNLFKYCKQPPKSPLFSEDDHSPLSRGHFRSQVRSALAIARFEATKFSSHSFRQGAASLATAMGFNNYEIQQLGMWHSNSYELYGQISGTAALPLIMLALGHYTQSAFQASSSSLPILCGLSMTQSRACKRAEMTTKIYLFHYHTVNA